LAVARGLARGWRGAGSGIGAEGREQRELWGGLLVPLLRHRRDDGVEGDAEDLLVAFVAGLGDRAGGVRAVAGGDVRGSEVLEARVGGAGGVDIFDGDTVELPEANHRDRDEDREDEEREEEATGRRLIALDEGLRGGVVGRDLGEVFVVVLGVHSGRLRG
jgi:hypothetical protein